MKSGLGLPCGTGLTLALLLAACSATSAYIERGRELEQAEMYEEALAEYQKAARREPDNPQLQADVKRLQSRLAEQAVEEGLSLRQMKDEMGALAAFLRAVRLAPENSAARQNLHRTVAGLLARVQKLQREEKAEESFRLAEKLHQQMPRDAQVKTAYEQARLAVAKTIMERVRDDVKKKLYGRALIGLVRVEQLVQVWGDSAELEVQARQALEQASRFGVKVVAARKPRRLARLSEQLAGMVGKKKPSACPTLQLPATGEARLILRLAVQKIDFKQDATTSEGEQKYQSGTRKVDNPQYQELTDKIAKDKERLSELVELLKQDGALVEECRQAFADAGPSDDEESLRRRLKQAEKARHDHLAEQKRLQDEVVELRRTRARTPRKVDEPVYDVFRYPIRQVKRTARVTVSLQAFGEARQRLLRDQLNGEASSSDKTNKAYRRYGVKGDPLRFELSDEQLVQRALAQAVAAIDGTLGKLCQRWQREILDRARAGASDAPLEAAEDYILYLFVNPGRPPADLVNFLKENFGLSDLKQLHPQAGQPAPAAKEPPSPPESSGEEGLEI